MFEIGDAEPGDGDCPRCSDDKQEEDRAEWLRRDILPHESFVRKVLVRKYPHADIEDVLQAAYLRLIGAPKVIHDKDGKAYLYLVAKSVIIDHVRRGQIRMKAGAAEADLDGLELVADEPTQEESLDWRRAYEQFTIALSQLPEKQRKVIELRRIEGLSSKDVAARVSRSVSSVEKTQLQAMRRLASAMQERASDLGPWSN